ncbi:hypothetical protein MRY87_11500 [bacterium]|nr:hypothetical protein [bacterium]
MGNDIRIETTNLGNFTTIRTCGNRIWFTGDQQLENTILGNLAQCLARYKAKIHALALEGTHKHELTLFPEGGQSKFFRDFNASVTRAVKRRYPKLFQHEEGASLWRRRFSGEHIPTDQDIEDKFFYIVLQPVKDGLVDSIEKYPGYNCFEDAVHGRTRRFKVVDWSKYNSHKRWKKKINIKDYTSYHELTYARLPGYEDLSQDKYAALMRKKLKSRTKALVNARKKTGKKFLGRERLLRVLPGTRNPNSKESAPYQSRPRILCSCPKTKKIFLQWYYDIQDAYKRTSIEYRAGRCEASLFPVGTHPPGSGATLHRAEPTG